MKLENGSKIAVIGGGPAGCFFSYFLLDLAERIGIDVLVDIYEPKDFSSFGPAGCNHCGGIVSESLVQLLATEGINLPSKVVQRGIDSYVLHMDVGSVRIETPLDEKRIAAMYRGAGPIGTKEAMWGSFDGFLQELNIKKGANLVKGRVQNIKFDDELPLVETKKGLSKTYDLVVGAVGINTRALKIFEGMGFGYKQPKTTKTFICEFSLGHEMVRRYFGSAMHVFLLDIPRLEFAALIPKGNFVSLVLLGKEIDKELVNSFLNTPEVKNCFPSDWDLSGCPCQCFPKINVLGPVQPFADRVVLLGDCADTKLYKNGIGSAYIAAKAAATTAILYGISSNDFKKHYKPTCRAIRVDNAIGKVIFTFTRLIQKARFAKGGILRMVSKENYKKGSSRHMSTVLWDTFTGSASYLDIFRRFFNPVFICNLVWEMSLGALFPGKSNKTKEDDMKTGDLGKVYKDGEPIVTQGEEGDCLYVIQEGTVDVVQNKGGKEVFLTNLSDGDFFGEIALFERIVRSSTVRAKGEVRVLTVDKKTLLPRIQGDPSLAFRIIQKMSTRIRELSDQVST